MDAFYASVEQRDNPALRGRPVAVGGAGGRGVVAAASYEARAFGVKSAMPSVTAIRRCPDLVFVKPRFDAYRAVSQKIRAIFADYADLVEPLSLDEAYLDVTEDRLGLGSATAIAEQIRARIFAETALTASAGVSYNKFVAKLASDQNKPDGLCVIPPAKGPAFVATLPVRRFHGVGPVTAARMETLGIHTGADLRELSPEFLARHFGSSGAYFHRAARGIDHRAVTPNRPHKSVGSETTFFENLMNEEAVLAALDDIMPGLMRRVVSAGVAGRTITLKVRYADFTQITRSRTASAATCDADVIAETARTLIRHLPGIVPGIRLLGVTLSTLVPQGDPQATDPQAALPM
ncbi:DNA polymerase IV [Sphingobium boeckii]